MLIKIKNNVPVANTEDGARILLTKPRFIQIMKAPGYPCYSSKKTIMEKWSSLPDYWGLVTKHGTPDPSEGPEVYFLDVEAMDELIEQFMPVEARINLAARNLYLKNGRC